jgi:Rha family phage regulatory protein
MNQLKVVSFNGQLVTDSREVAETIGKRHADLLRDIKGYKAILDQNAKLRSADFFIESTYKNSNNQSYPCYLLTKQGCEMVANKLTGEKGVLFTAAYVTKFNEMEKQQPVNNTKLLLQTALEHEEKIEIHDKRISLLEETMRIDGIQERKLQNKGNQVVIEFLGGKNSPAYKDISRKAFSELWRDFKNHFMIPRYSELPKKQFEEGLRFIGLWQPSTSLRIEIENTNKQQTFKGVI